ncbi:sensor histidine kinase [Paenibacillus yanchengensis]|uniref:histidine kinase n=1 Tax=Paenibacillus yanchengensis TaxID=2035833 RepID=A0ABW4YNT5_9BACL
MLNIEKRSLLFWNKSLIWKFMIINGLVIGVVIWLVGVSVKDFACLLVDQYDYIGAEKQTFFNSTMHYYLVRASAIAVVVAVLLYYFLMRKVLLPLKNLTNSTKQMMTGTYPEPVVARANDEIGQLGNHFNQMVESLKQAETSRKQLFSDLSHELRTPLSNLNGYLEALSSGVIHGNQELYTSLHEEVQHITKLVDQMQQLTVWEQKKLQPQAWSEVDTRKLLQQVHNSFELELKNKQVSCHIDVEPMLIEVDETGMKQVVSNLLSNAIAYNTSDWITIKGSKQTNYYELAITNKGEPIPIEKAALIFERMVRVDESRHRDIGGSGLGLAIAKEIVSLHGGQIVMQTKDLQHTFLIQIPLRQHKSTSS